MSISDTSLKSLSKFLFEFLAFKGIKNVILLGNSMGGHIGLLFTKNYPELLKGLIITGSSGLYENNMGDKYPNRENYDWIKSKTECPNICTGHRCDCTCCAGRFVLQIEIAEVKEGRIHRDHNLNV